MPLRCGVFNQSRVELEQVFNLLLQLLAVCEDNGRNLLLRLAELANDLVVEELHALADGGQRSFEFVGYMSYEHHFLLFQCIEAVSEPLDAIPEGAHIRGTRDPDGL